MSYQLEYDLQSVKVIKNPSRKNFMRFGMLLTVLVIGAIAAHVLGTLFQAAILMPGETAKTAADELVESMRNGESFRDSLQTFCSALSE